MTLETLLQNEILKEIIVALIVSAITGAALYLWKHRYNLKVVLFIQLFRNIKKSGMSVFFYNKDMLRQQLGTVGNEIAKARKQFIYIGYTMSDIVRQDLSEAIINAVTNDGVQFEFCILDEASESTALYAEYTGRDIEYIRVSLKNAEKMLENIRSQLPDDKKDFLKLYRHDKFIPSSCFLGDIQEEYGWIHFNYKAPGAAKLQDFGFILKKSEFYDRMKSQYLSLLRDIYLYNQGGS